MCFFTKRNTIFISLNLYSGVYSRGVVKFEAERNVFSSSMQGLSMTLVLGWSVVYFLFHSFWNKLFSLSTIQMVLMFLIIWGTSAFSFWSTEQRVVFKYKSLIVITLIMSAAKPILGIIFGHLSVDKVTARIFAIAIVEVFKLFKINTTKDE